jgi:uncharacterized protein
MHYHMVKMFKPALLLAWFGILLSSASVSLVAADPLRIVFLGDQGHHRPSDLAGRIVPVLKQKGIDLQYTEDMNVLSTERLKEFDGLMVYANIDAISKEQEKALLDFVASGKGFIPVHCATYCFRNSDAYIELCGAQFLSHGGEEFETVIVDSSHPVMKGFGGFRSWDETYVHTRHNEKDRTVLEVRRQGGQAKGNKEEPWTWVRMHGKGRVFYTAWGHDTRTWSNPGFHNLLERGMLWACGRNPADAGDFSDSTIFPVPQITEFRKDVKPFTYTDVGAKIPNYTPGPKWGTQAEPLTKMQDPLTAEESIKHYITPVEFAPHLWASEPDLQGKPIGMNWDDRGRLWICETVDYPNELQPPGKGRDRIRICEDTNGDGKADKFTVFAEQLSVPTTLVHYRGGVIVQDGQTTVYLKDIDGDDHADFRQELITGWAIGDTHGGVSNFQYGLDNWIWGMQGYNDSHPIINGKEQQGFRQGFFRFRVEPGLADETAPVKAASKSKLPTAKILEQHTIRVKELEYVRATNNNTWGLGFSEEGLVFGSTANGNPSNFMPIANRYYEQVKGWSPDTLQMISDTFKFDAATDKVRQVDWHGGYTAGAGHALYTARKYPKSWWNRTAFVCEPTGHIVGAFVLNRDGAGYRSTSPFNLLASDDEWAAPIMAEVGPDGNVWVSDWYNYIVQHNPTPHGFKTGKGAAYESDLRDKTHGRIYRIEYQGNSEPLSEAAAKAEAITKKGLQQASTEQLIHALSSPTMRWRLVAQRLLIDKNATDKASTDALCKLITNESVDAVGLNTSAIHALWTLAGLNQINPKVSNVWSAASGALKHKSAGVRRAAIQVLPPSAASCDLIVSAGLLEDADPQVRLAALLKLANGPGDFAKADATLANVETVSQNDRWLLDAWVSAAAGRSDRVLALVLADTRPLLSNLQERVSIVSEHFARSQPTAEQVKGIFASMEKGSTDRALAVLSGMSRGWPSDYDIQVDEAAGKSMVAILEKLPVGGKSEMIQLAARLGAASMKEQIRKISDQLLEVALNNETSPEGRVDAAKQLVAMQPTEDSIVDSLLEGISPQTPPDVVFGFLDSLIESRSSRVGPALIGSISMLTPDAKGNAFRVLLSRPETTMQLLNSMKEGKLDMNDLRLDQRQALRDHPDTNVRELAMSIMASGGGVPNADRAKVVEDWMEVTKLAGSASRGKEMYKKHCSLCHIHNGEGVNIGPDLSGMAVHPKGELLMNILDPSRSVEGNFRTYTVLTSDGVVKTGMLAGESRTSIELINTQGKRETVLREDIDSMKASNKSLMPEGFESQMSREEITDLLEFLASKGKYVPLPLGKVASAISTKGLFSDSDKGPDRMIFSDWSQKTFEGVPFVLVDPQGDRVPNIVLLHGPNGPLPPKMPKSVNVVCNAPAAAIHFLSGVSGWGFPYSSEKSVSMIVRLHYADGETEDHPLINGEQFADYIRRVDVPGSQFAFNLQGQQIRYLKVEPKRREALKEIELIKGPDSSAPIVMAMTLESP